MERWLLRTAPSPQALFGLVLEADDPSTRETLRRAASKLEEIGLLERHRVRRYVRARDTRGEGLILRDGAFWTRADPTRAHAVRRNVVWQSAFGFEIVRRYGAFLESGEPIRWDARTVNRALDMARTPNREDRHIQLANREEVERDEVVLADRSRRELVPAIPDEVSASGDVRRWQLAVAVAVARFERPVPDTVWVEALKLWTTESTEALAELASHIPRPEPGAGERFRRRRRSALGS